MLVYQRVDTKGIGKSGFAFCISLCSFAEKLWRVNTWYLDLFFRLFRSFNQSLQSLGISIFLLTILEECQSLRLAGPHDPYVTYVTLTVSGGHDALSRRAFQYYESHGLKPQGVCKNRTGFWVWIQLIYGTAAHVPAKR